MTATEITGFLVAIGGLAGLYRVWVAWSRSREHSVTERENRLYDRLEQQIEELRAQHEDCQTSNAELLRKLDAQSALIVEQTRKIDAMQVEINQLRDHLEQHTGDA